MSCRWPICDTNIKVGLQKYLTLEWSKTSHCLLLIGGVMERSWLSRRLTYLGICYSCSIVRPISLLPTSRIFGYSQPSEMRRCSCFSTLMRTISEWLLGSLSDKRYKTLSTGFYSEGWKYVENKILFRSSAWLKHASHIREDFGLIPMWRCNWIITYQRIINILFVGWLVINRQ